MSVPSATPPPGLAAGTEPLLAPGAALVVLTGGVVDPPPQAATVNITASPARARGV
jgi:hypothetical protein